MGRCILASGMEQVPAGGKAAGTLYLEIGAMVGRGPRDNTSGRVMRGLVREGEWEDPYEDMDGMRVREWLGGGKVRMEGGKAGVKGESACWRRWCKWGGGSVGENLARRSCFGGRDETVGGVGERHCSNSCNNKWMADVEVIRMARKDRADKRVCGQELKDQV